MAIDGINTNNYQTNFAAPAQEAVRQEGVLMGHAVEVVESPQSLLADAAEELGFAVDTTEDYEISERKERESSEVSKKLQELYRVQMEKLGKTHQADDLVAFLKRCAGREAMRHAVESRYGEPAEAWGMLSYALEVFENDPSVSESQRADLKAVLDDYTAQHATEIKLGIQGALASEGYADLVDCTEGAAFYRTTVGEFSSVNEVFEDIKARYGDKFDRAMDFLFSAISSDIGCEMPSMDKSHLESVHGKLEVVRLTQSAFILCEKTVDRWKTTMGQTESPLTAMGLLEDVVALRGKSYVGAPQVDAIVKKAAPKDIEHEVLFVQELMNLARQFPVALFDNEEGRMTVMDAVQAAVDSAVQREDEYLASLE